jgi:hypothetical protein
MFNEGINDHADIQLEASFADWSALAEKKLNPWIGVV